MPIDINCPCGMRSTVPDRYAGKVARCRRCGRQFIVSARNGASGADFHFTEEELNSAVANARADSPTFVVSIEPDNCPEDSPPSRPSVAVLLMGLVIPLAIILAFSCYIYAQGAQARFEAALRSLKAEADALDRAGRFEEAYRKLMTLLGAAKNAEILEAATKDQLAAARDRAVQLFPLAKEMHERRMVAREKESSTETDMVLGAVAMIALAIFLLLLPLVLPPILARIGCLSMIRWVIMASFFLFLGAVVVCFWYVAIGRGDRPLVSGLGFFSVWLLLGVPG